MAKQVICTSQMGNSFYSWYDVYYYCQKTACGSLSPPDNHECFSACSWAVFPCDDYEPPVNEIDTVYIQQCDTTDFYNDFNNAINNKAMGIFLASVMAGILAVRAVIKVIKGAVR
jgi:hypothetical protein